MSTQIKFRGGTTTEHTSFTGAERELTVDTTKDTLVIHDGALVGGYPLARVNSIYNFTCGNLTSVGIDDNATSIALVIDSNENVNFAQGVTVTGSMAANSATITGTMAANAVTGDGSGLTNLATYGVKASSQTGGAGIDLDTSTGGTDTVTLKGLEGTEVIQADANTINIKTPDNSIAMAIALG